MLPVQRDVRGLVAGTRVRRRGRLGARATRRLVAVAVATAFCIAVGVAVSFVVAVAVAVVVAIVVVVGVGVAVAVAFGVADSFGVAVAVAVAVAFGIALVTKSITNQEGDRMEIKSGENWIIDDGANRWMGRVVYIVFPFTVWIEDVAWISDTGRLHQFMRDGRTDNMEIEYLGDRSVVAVQMRTAIKWPHDLIRETV